jgi:glutamate synthase domain-containing protein 3
VPIASDHLEIGMHGGVIYIRGAHTKGKELSVLEPDEKGMKLPKKYLVKHCERFSFDRRMFYG